MEFDKSKVYTALNADESLIGARGYFANTLITLKECVVNGILDFQNTCGYGSVDFVTLNTINDYNFFYLVKPVLVKTVLVKNLKHKQDIQSKYRPFKNCDELIKTYLEKLKGYYDVSECPIDLPTIWVKSQNIEITRFMITSFGDGNVTLDGSSPINLNTLCNQYTFLDGSVCGIEL